METSHDDFLDFVAKFDKLRVWIIGLLLGAVGIGGWAARLEFEQHAMRQADAVQDKVIENTANAIQSNQLSVAVLSRDIDNIKTMQQEMRVDVKELLREVKTK